MKKILSLALVLVSVFLLASCTGSTATACENHVDANGDFTCDTCGAMYICQNHVDANADALCDTCMAPYTCPGHADANNDGKCDVCLAAYTCPGHTDVNADGRCDVCLYEFICQHTDADGNGVCDKCMSRFTCQKHMDSNDADSKCDYCGQEFECVDHRDVNGDSVCDICAEPYTCPGHIDANKDDKCDRCGAFGSALTDVKADSIAAFIRASKNSEPTKVVTNTVYVTGEGSSARAYNISSVLVSGTVDGSIAAVYTSEYPTLKNVEEGSGNIIVDVIANNVYKMEFLQGSGVRETLNGVVQKVGGNEWAVGKNFAPAKGEIALGITASNINVTEFVIEENRHEMHFVVSKAKVNEVFGKTGATANIDASGDVNVILTSNGAVITSVQISYKIAGSSKDNIPDQTVTIVTEYGYSVQSIDIVK